MAQFEDILEKIGTFGPFQIRIYILVSMFEAPANWGLMLPIFVSAMPEFRCPVLSDSSLGNMTSYRNQSEGACEEGGSVCPEVEYTSQFTSVVSEWNLLCDKEHVPSLITSVQMGGLLVGATLFGQLGDMFGRKQMLYPTYSLFLLAGFLSAFANSWQLYMLCRFFVGLFYAGAILQNFILPMECVGSRWRTLCGTFGCYTFGSMTLAGLAYFIRNWRHLTITTTVGGVLILLSWWFVPESPRWLIKKGRLVEAERILARAAKFNGRPVPDFSEIQSIYQQDQKSQADQKRYSYTDLFRNWTMAKYTLISMYGWFTVSVAYFGITFNLGNLSGDVYFNVFLAAVVEFGPTIFVIAFSNRLGRRRITMLLLSVGAVACLAIIALDLVGKMDNWPWVTNTCAIIGKLGVGGAWDSVSMTSVELFPTVVRNMGVGISSVSGRIAAVLAPQLVYLVKYYRAVPFLVAGVMATVATFLLLLLPETANKPLTEDLPPRTCCMCCAGEVLRQDDVDEKGVQLVGVNFKQESS